MEPSVGAGILHLWRESDAVAIATAGLLLAMSIATWYLIVAKTLQVWRLRRQASAIPLAFWSAPGFDAAVMTAHAAGRTGPFSMLADAAAAIARPASDAEAPTLDASLERSDYVARGLRRALQRASRRLEAGLSVLASVGATAPFVGLFGTVWGIYHALTDIGLSGQVSIDKVAGPVGEALVMTALGIAVAVPAVLAYNFLLRANRAIAQELDGFARDLHAYLLRMGATQDAHSDTHASPLASEGGRRI